MAILKRSLPLLAIFVGFLAVSTAENQAFRSTVSKDYTFDAVADFMDRDEFDFDHRRLQNNNKGSTGGSTSGGSTSGGGATETSRCNFWCMLKNSMAQTVIGLLLICIRLVLHYCLSIKTFPTISDLFCFL